VKCGVELASTGSKKDLLARPVPNRVYRISNQEGDEVKRDKRSLLIVSFFLMLRIAVNGSAQGVSSVLILQTQSSGGGTSSFSVLHESP
jgi:hypothetical protein